LEKGQRLRHENELWAQLRFWRRCKYSRDIRYFQNNIHFEYEDRARRDFKCLFTCEILSAHLHRNFPGAFKTKFYDYLSTLESSSYPGKQRAYLSSYV